MSLQFTCSKLPAALEFSFFVFLLPPVFTQSKPNHIYFLDKGDDILLKGPDSPGDGPVVWEWNPHSEQEIQQLVTFHKRTRGWLDVEWNKHFQNNDLYQKIELDPGSINLRIRNATFDFSGLFTLTQTDPKQILKCYEVFGIKVESSLQESLVGSDITLSCTISRFSDTVSLQWKQRDSSQLNRRKTDQIRLNNTAYLIVKHVAVEDQDLYECEVKENGPIILTVKANFSVTQYLYWKSYTLYRSGTGHSEFYLICYYYNNVVHSYNNAGWYWKTHHLQNLDKRIASAWKSQSIILDRTDFEHRLVPTVATFDGVNFNMRIVPVLFEDAGIFTCLMEAYKYVTITLITVKVTAEPSDAVSEGDTVTLTCSVSDVTESMRLVWISSDGKTVVEKTLKNQNQEEDLLQLIIQKADRDRRNWTCVLFHQNTPKIFIPYYLKVHNLFVRNYTLFRSGMDHNELDLICYDYYGNTVRSHNTASWSWRSLHFQNQGKKIASASESQPINVNRTYFGNRLIPIMANFNGLNFSMRIVPVRFEDAGVYTCSLGSSKLVTIKMITVKVTAEPSDAVSEGDTVTLTCSVSDVTESMRLVWISSDGETGVEKTLNGWNGEEKSLRLIIQKAERGSSNWTCVLFHQNISKIFIPYYLKVNNDSTFKLISVVIFVSLVLFLFIILSLVLCLRKRKFLGGNETPVPQPSSFPENATVDRKAKKTTQKGNIFNMEQSFFRKRHKGADMHNATNAH